MGQVFSGTGPGTQAPDGCSVNLYRLLPYMGELAEIEPHLLRHHAALELGCGTGRLCSRMQKLGLRVTGVDESAEMLAHLPTGVEGIKASIETLNLGRTWPAVLLPSHLINHPDPSTREQFVAAAKRHIASSGTFFVKRHSPEWLSSVAVGKIGESGPVTFYADRVERNGRLVMMTIRYSAPDAEWTQSFSTCALEQGDIEDLLTSHGFGSFRWLGRQSLWLASTQRDA